MPGLISVGRNTQAQGMSGLSTVAGLEAAGNEQRKQIEAARRAQTMQMVGTGAGMGASIGLAHLGGGAAAAGTAAAGTAAAGGVAAGTAAAGTAAATGAAAAGTAAATGAAATGAAATGAAATGAAGAGALGLGATLGAIAPPLLIGAGAALLLDQVFDIF